MLFVQLGGGGGKREFKKIPKKLVPPPKFLDPLTEVRKCFVPTPPKKNTKEKKIHYYELWPSPTI